MYFDKELEFLKSKEEENFRKKLSKVELDKILLKYPNVPSDYINFLSEVGEGNLRDHQFKIYSSLIDFYDLGLENVYQLPEEIKLFGDNFAGDFAGFDISSKTDLVFEFLHDSDKIYNTGKTFREFIRDKILMNF